MCGYLNTNSLSAACTGFADGTDHRAMFCLGDNNLWENDVTLKGGGGGGVGGGSTRAHKHNTYTQLDAAR